MFKLGEIIISEKAIKKVSLDFIYESIQEYLKEAIIYIQGENDDDEEKRIFQSCLEDGILFKRDFIVDGKMILYIETSKEKGTSILEGQEYLKRYIENFAYHFTISEKDFLKVVLNKYEEGTKYERKISQRILRKFKNLDDKKNMLIDSEGIA